MQGLSAQEFQSRSIPALASVDRSEPELADDLPASDFALADPDSSCFSVTGRRVNRPFTSCVDGRPGARYVMHVHFILSATFTLAALQVLGNQFGVKHTLPIHIFNHLRNRRRVLADDREI